MGEGTTIEWHKRFSAMNACQSIKSIESSSALQWKNKRGFIGAGICLYIGVPLQFSPLVLVLFCTFFLFVFQCMEHRFCIKQREQDRSLRESWNNGRWRLVRTEIIQSRNLRLSGCVGCPPFCRALYRWRCFFVSAVALNLSHCCWWWQCLYSCSWLWCCCRCVAN